MSSPAYEVYVTTTYNRENHIEFRAIEIMPPISHALATLACREVESYCERLFEYDNPGQKLDPPVKVTAYGFCDEGATVSTLVRFDRIFSFDDGDAEAPERWLATRVKSIISPSGAAIAKK